MFCKYCGVPVLDDCRACPSCGGRLISETETAVPEREGEEPIALTFAPEQENSYSDMQWQSTVREDTASARDGQEEEQPEPSDTKKKIRLLTAGMIVLALLALQFKF